MSLNRLSGNSALLIAALAIVVLAGVQGFDLYFGREKAIALNIRHIEQNDRMFAEHVARSLDSIDILLDEMSIVIQEGGHWKYWDQETGHQLLKSRLSRALPQVRHLLIFDAAGNQRHTSFAERPPSINIVDRPYFKALVAGAERSRYGPYKGRNSALPTYAMARRLGRERLEGALVVAIEPAYFEAFCRSSRPYGDFETAIINPEGRILTLCRSLADEAESRPAKPGDDFRKVFGDGELESMPLDANRNVRQTKRFVLATEPVAGHNDLSIVSVTPRGVLTQDWREQAVRTILLAGFALLTLLAAGLLIRYHLRKLASVTAALRASHESLGQRVELATRELENRRNEALRMADAKSRFFAAASHDLRQPLHALQLFLADLSRLTQDAEQRVLVERIESATRSIAEQLRSLLDISRLDMSNITPERKRLALKDVFSQLADTYAAPAEKAGVRLLFRPRDVQLETDPALLLRLIGNLIDNAIKFAPGGTALVCARWRANAVRVEVRDNGRGIAAEHQGEIFDEFFQIENRARDPNAGLGLGLAIAHRIARLLGASITLRSAVGKGAVFSMTLPCITGKAIASAGSEAAAIPSIILIPASELDLAASQGLSERARRWGYKVIATDNVTAAWRLLEVERGIPVLLHTGSCALSAESQSLLRQYPGVVITGEDCAMPELGAYHLREPVKPARLRALLRSLH